MRLTTLSYLPVSKYRIQTPVRQAAMRSPLSGVDVKPRWLPLLRTISVLIDVASARGS